MTRTEAFCFLGLDPLLASTDEIRTAFRKAAKRHHPDHGGDPTMFRAVVEAYELVTRKKSATPMEWAALFRPAKGGKVNLGSESKFQTEVIKKVESMGAFVLNVHGHAMQRSGMPDLYIAHKLWTGWIELKVGDRRVSALQQVCINQLVERWVPAMVVRRLLEGTVAEMDDGLQVIRLAELGSLSFFEFLNRATANQAAIVRHRVGEHNARSS